MLAEEVAICKSTQRVPFGFGDSSLHGVFSLWFDWNQIISKRPTYVKRFL